jgi:hypothetical protein
MPNPTINRSQVRHDAKWNATDAAVRAAVAAETAARFQKTARLKALRLQQQDRRLTSPESSR